MKIISLGYTCYMKSLINETIFRGETNILDWMYTFYFKYIISSLENGFNICNNLSKSHLEVDSNSVNTLYNNIYHFRLPHENSGYKEKYKRRYDRFLNYKQQSDNFLFIRLINISGRYGVNSENINENYSEQQFNDIMNCLPKNSKILLLTHEIIPDDKKRLFYNKFYVIDNIINPEHISFGDMIKYKNNIIKFYNEFFSYIDKNYHNLNICLMKNFISNKRLYLI